MDNVFDSVNGSYKKKQHAKPLLGPATPKSIHKKTLSEAIGIFKSMKFVTSDGKQESGPTVANWVWTLTGIQILLKKLQSEFGINSVWLRHLNQDPLENFCGAVRSHGCRNINPACDQFESAFATLLINNLNSVHIRGKNCKDDFCDALHALVINENAEKPSSTSTVDLSTIVDINFTPIEEKQSDPRKIGPLQYISGYLLKKAKTHVFKDCAQCKEDLSSQEEIEYIRYREYEGRRWLSTPNRDLIELISNMQDLINQIVKENLKKIICQKFSKLQ